MGVAFAAALLIGGYWLLYNGKEKFKGSGDKPPWWAGAGGLIPYLTGDSGGAGSSSSGVAPVSPMPLTTPDLPNGGSSNGSAPSSGPGWIGA
jgi:hypothetical protein